MDHEALIRLELEQQEDCVLVSSPDFPLLHLEINSASGDDIEQTVLPVLKEMVEFRVGRAVTLRLNGGSGPTRVVEAAAITREGWGGGNIEANGG